MFLLAMIQEYTQNYTDLLVCLGQNHNNLGHSQNLSAGCKSPVQFAVRPCDTDITCRLWY